MKYVIDHDYHIHSYLSSCSRHPEQTKGNILKYAKNHGFSSICMTDHFWDSAVEGASRWYSVQNFEHISESLPLPVDDEVKFLFGCECDMNKEMTLGLARENFNKFDFVVIPTTHLHMNGFTVEGTEGSSERAELWVRRLDRLLSMDIPFEKVGIAHLACTLIDVRSLGDLFKTLSYIETSDMHDLFSIAANKGAGIELNLSDMKNAIKHPEEILKMFRIAKDAGCKFYLGSDAHLPDEFANVQRTFEYAVEALGLTEDDKFRIKGV